MAVRRPTSRGVRRLRDFHEVTLILEGHRATSIVVATAGCHAWLEPHGDAQLVHAALPAPAKISFLRDDRLVLLSGRAAVDRTGCVEFHAEDRAYVPNLRAAARLTISLPVRITPVDAGTRPPVRSSTIDLGRGGLRTAAQFVAPPGSPVDLVIELPDELANVTARASVVRNGANGTALAFVDLAVEEAERLESIVISVRRRIAQRQIEIAEQSGRYLSLGTAPTS
jgi:hypothetical protein